VTYTIEYYAGPYEGRRTVEADGPEAAIAQVRAWVRRNMTLPMYADGYRVISDLRAALEGKP